MTGAELITAERQRQIEQEGWTPEHDDEHKRGEMEDAAECYWQCAANPGAVLRILEGTSNPRWPWNWQWFKPWDNNHQGYFPAVDHLRCLVKAGALLQAEHDRYERLSPLVNWNTAAHRQRILHRIRAVAAEIDRLQRAMRTKGEM